ncbi:phosphoribulokinase [Paenibacillus lycopersici]|uniref:Phosphoribulokinase n=1 Tax=Paenibacillus lycopersici TaxID=2704462 RepID=A0A6C0FWI0_9BACL|nr:phosphoribulokinase [Paenibacillus lycopersici]QHT61486.1 phosphoribulokinase [Paenibacillus lycopersici]
MNKVIEEVVNRLSGRNGRTIIGISGHGASGKTTLTRQLVELLGPDHVNVINTDTYLIGSALRKYTLISYDYRNERHQDKMTACHPAAHNSLALERDLRMIRDGMDLYTIRTEFAEQQLISPHNGITIVEGMTVAFTNLDLYDSTIYLYTDGETELTRRSDRDVNERGRDIEALRQSHDERRIQYELFMHPRCHQFDIIIRSSNEGCVLEK